MALRVVSSEQVTKERGVQRRRGDQSAQRRGRAAELLLLQVIPPGEHWARAVWRVACDGTISGRGLTEHCMLQSIRQRRATARG